MVTGMQPSGLGGIALQPEGQALDFCLDQGRFVELGRSPCDWGRVSLSRLIPPGSSTPGTDLTLVRGVRLRFALPWRWWLKLIDSNGKATKEVKFPGLRATRAALRGVRATLQLRSALQSTSTVERILALGRDLYRVPEAWIDRNRFQVVLTEARRLQRSLNRLSGSERAWIREHVLSDAIFRRTDQELDQDREKANDRFCSLMEERYGAFLDSVECHPLSGEQRRAVMTDEWRTRVVAAAGSGKTSVLVAKAGLLHRAEFTRPEQICLLAFNSKAADELEERIKDRLGIAPTIKTFHALGLSILGQASGSKPRLRKECEPGQERALRMLFEELIGADLKAHSGASYEYLSAWSGLKSQLEALSLQGEGPWWTRWLGRIRISTPHEQAVRDQIKASAKKIKSRVEQEYIPARSPQEVEILNHLRHRGFDFVYEPTYPHPSADREHGVYRPDFMIRHGGKQIFLEHQALRRDGSSSLGEEYVSKVAWVRRFHARQGTTLVESFSWWWQDPSTHWTGRLSEALAAVGVDLPSNTIKDFDRARALLLPEPSAPGQERDPEIQTRNLFYGTLARFISLARERGSKADDLSIPESFHAPGCTDQLRIFSRILGRYEAWLEEVDGCDFPAMIADAVAAIRSGAFRPPWTHLLVDEFQDISEGRMRLLEALLEAAPEMKLFVVGDDWQAINRFAGADIGIMADLEGRLMSEVLTMPLATTYRCQAGIVDVSSRFIQRNPKQIRKQVRPLKPDQPCPGVTIHYEDPQLRFDDVRPVVEAVLQKLHRDFPGKEILILARYRYLVDNETQVARWRSLAPGLRVSTIHGAKGQEADFVIVVGLSSGPYGFPARREDVAVLQAVLPPADQSITDAEERRLFYVALTRARYAVHVIASRSEPSDFATELEETARDQPSLVHVDGSALPGLKHCPSCHRGHLTGVEGGYGRFYRCNLLCGYKEEACPVCHRGMIVVQGSSRVCGHRECRTEVPPCPRCMDGWLVRKRNRSEGTFFLGCSNYWRPDDPCGYTQNLRSK